MQLEILDTEIEHTLKDLDDISHAPLGTEPSVWNRFINARKQKIHVENTIKWKATVLNEMSLYHQRRCEEEENLKREVEEHQKYFSM